MPYKDGSNTHIRALKEKIVLSVGDSAQATGKTSYCGIDPGWAHGAE